MTSSEHDGGMPAGGPEPVPPRGSARVLAAGHLHPGVLFLRVLDGLRSAILPLLIGLIAKQTWLLLAAPVGFVMMLSYALVRYLTFRYVLTEDELVTTEGILSRQERRIPVDRIQDLNFESSLLRRLTGLVVVSVETASGQGSEASLDSLGRREAVHLREALLRVRAARGHAAAGEGAAEARPAETVLFRSTAGELTLLGLTDNRIGAIVVGVYAIFEFADQLGLGGTVIGAAAGAIDRVAGMSPPLVVVLVVAVLFLFLIAGWLLAIAASFVKFHDFSLMLRDDVLQRRFGLITTRSQTLPRRRIQRVLIEQTPLRRLLRLAVLRADSAGSGMDPKEEVRSGRDIVAPVTEVARAEALVPWLLDGLDARGLGFHRVSPRLVWRLFAEGCALALALATAGWLAVGPLGLLALALLPIAFLFGWLAYHNLGYLELEDYVALRWGILGRYRSFVPLRKVQAVRLEAGPVDRAFGLASLVIYVAGGSPTRLHHLPRETAERLVSGIAQRAAARRFVW